MTSSNMKEVQVKIVNCIEHLSDITKLEVKDDIIQNILYQIPEQEIELKKFSIEYKLKMSTHANDLIRFAESCEGDNISSEELLESLKRLNDDKLNENKAELLNQILNVKNSLGKIVDEISEYNKKITEGHTGLTNKIDETDQNKEEATMLARTSLMIVGIGAMATTAVATAGTSLTLAIPAKAIFTLGMSLTSQGTGTAAISSVIAGYSFIRKSFLNKELKNIRGQISQLLRELQQILEVIDEIIKICESNFKKQIAEIEEVEKVVDFIKKLGDKQLVKPIAKTISTRARKNSVSYS